MNEKTKRLMHKQKEGIFNSLQTHFTLPVFEDEMAEDEEKQLDKKGYNCFIFETSEFQTTEDIKKLKQNIYVSYYSENKDDVDETTIDIISVLTPIKGVTFSSSKKERLQMKETDRFIDRVRLTFTRVIPIEYQV
ncbi:hypothetical protein [Neobacillus niacini]|uniref:hypothetical protein n=1 Tax=Neobacillus niacini TaxID=86668 RepID=UPI002FFFF2EC